MSDNIGSESFVDSRSRKWQVTINNPVDKGFTREVIKSKVSSLSSLIYWCISDEIGSGGTPHVHFFMAFANAVRFSTIKKLFEGGHFEMCNGSSSQNRDYVFKIGKHKNTDKEETNLKDTHEEFGSLPVERPGRRSDLDTLYDMVQSGMTAHEIIKECPSYMTMRKHIDELIYDKHKTVFGSCFRHMHVTYVFGATGTGKTSDIIKEFGYQNIYRVVDYKNPFDNYSGQDIIVFEEFRGQISLPILLNMIDGHPFDLPCRYHNKVACFSQVFFTSNVPLRDLYKTYQTGEVESYKALLRRIHIVKFYDGSKIRVMPIEEYMGRYLPLISSTDSDGFVHVPKDVQISLPF